MTSHPAWCSRTWCTAPATVPEVYTGPAGAHHSRPVTLTLGSMALAPVQTVKASLYRSVAPWRVYTYLVLKVDASTEISIEVGQARGLLGQLAGLLDEAGE